MTAFASERPGQPVRLFCQDETRIGLHLPRYRRLSGRGVKPYVTEHPLYEYYWLYGAVEPLTGESFFLEMPSLDGDTFSVFLRELSRAYPDSLNVVVVDNAGAHTAHHVTVPSNVVLLPLPPYCPELNPAERLWLDLKRHIDVTIREVREDLVVLRDHVADRIRSYTIAQMQSLTGYSYLVAAVNALE